MRCNILIIIFCSLISCTNKENNLVGEWVFVTGSSNDIPTFTKENNRRKVFQEDGVFYVFSDSAGGEKITMEGMFKMLDGQHFRENIGANTTAIYKFKIKSDTLKFEGKLEIPSKQEGFKTVLVKEKWVRKK